MFSRLIYRFRINMEATFVVVGGGIAGVSCAEMLLNITEDRNGIIL